MQVSVEAISKIERRLTIVVPVAEVEEAYGKQIHTIASQAKIKGFRPGKAPLSYIKQRFSDDARKEALSEVIQNSLYAALQQEKLDPISTPRVEPKVLAPNQPLEFTASFEILPQMEKVNFTLAHAEKPVVTIGDEEINVVIEQLRKQFTSWRVVVDRPVQEKDRVVVDYYIIYDGNAEMEKKVTDYPIEIGSHTMLSGFEEGLIGSHVGDEKTLHLTYPDNFPDQEKAGKPVDFVVHIKQIFQADLPPMDGPFIQKLGAATGTEEELREQIKSSIEKERDRLVREKLKEQVFRILLEQNPLEVPQVLVQREAQHIHDEIYPNHDHHKDHHHSEEETATFQDIARKRVALGLLINEYAKQASLKIERDRVIARIQEIAAAYEHPQEVVQWLSSKERLAGIEAQIMEEQTMEKLLEGVNITEKIMSFAELRGIER